MEKKKNKSIQESLLSFDFSELTSFQKFKLIVASFFVLLFIIAFIQNFKTVEISFVFWHFELSISLLILITVFIGGVIAYFREERKMNKKNKIIAELQAKIEKLEKDLGSKK